VVQAAHLGQLDDVADVGRVGEWTTIAASWLSTNIVLVGPLGSPRVHAAMVDAPRNDG
jgi:hypothetical protein